MIGFGNNSISLEKTMTGGGGSGGYTLSAGDTLGQYRIVRPLGRGGMGEVYEAEHKVLRKRYALKLLGAEMTARPDAVERFEREAQVMANLEHPNVLAVDDYGQHEGRYWLRMKLAGDGGDVRSLEDLVRDNGGNLDADIWQMVMTRVLEGLAYAHERGVVHRDLKPSNILLSVTPDGKECLPVIADFGLARLVGEDWLRSQVEQSVRMSMSIGDARTVGGRAASAEGTSTRALLGTYEYMSPEQKRGEEATAASDVYAIGLMGYRLLTGRSPTMKQPSELVPGLSSSWDRWIGDCLEENPRDRPTAKQLLERMPAKMMGPPKPATPKPSSLQADATLPHPKRRGVKLLLAAVLLAVAAGVLGWVARYAPERFQVERVRTRGDSVEKTHEVRVGLADLTPVQSEARVKWRRAQALDREQGFGELLDACEVQFESANSFAATGDYPRALEAYREVMVKCDEIHERESLRQAAVGAQEQAAMARDRAEQFDAASEAVERWATGGRAFSQAGELFESGDFAQASDSWREAALVFVQAEERVDAAQAYRKAKSDYEAAFARDKVLLESHGGDRWHEVLRLARVGEVSANDPVEGGRSYGQALAGLPAAVTEARTRERLAQINAALSEARQAKARERWQEVVTAADRVLALDANHREAQVLKREAEGNIQQARLKVQAAAEARQEREAVETGRDEQRTQARQSTGIERTTPVVEPPKLVEATRLDSAQIRAFEAEARRQQDYVKEQMKQASLSPRVFTHAPIIPSPNSYEDFRAIAEHSSQKIRESRLFSDERRFWTANKNWAENMMVSHRLSVDNPQREHFLRTANAHLELSKKLIFTIRLD